MPDATKAVASKVEFESRLFSLVAVTKWTRLRLILTITALTVIALASGASQIRFDLSRSGSAVRTNDRVKLGLTHLKC